jgi:hypothetical protein
MKTKTVTMIDVDEWDKLVKDTYKKPYSFQQQDGCKDRGIFNLTVPSSVEDFVPEIVNHEDMGVSFKAWLARDPKQPLEEDKETWAIVMWWERNFYPDIQIVANDLHEKGLLEAGEYTINIDW